MCTGRRTTIKTQWLQTFKQYDIVILCLSNLTKNLGLIFSVLDFLISFFCRNSFLAFLLQKYAYDRLEIKILIFHHRWFEKHSVEDKICKCCLPLFAPKYNIRYQVLDKDHRVFFFPSNNHPQENNLRTRKVSGVKRLDGRS